MFLIKRFSSSYVKAVERFLTGSPEWEGTFMKYTSLSRCKVIDADSKKYIKYEFAVTKDVLNAAGKLHEGCIATLLDVCMGNLMYDETKTTIEQSGVTVDLSISYIKTVSLGDTIVIDTYTAKHGKKLVFLKANVYRKSDNEIVATGKQIMAHLPKEWNNKEK